MMLFSHDVSFGSKNQIAAVDFVFTVQGKPQVQKVAGKRTMWWLCSEDLVQFWHILASYATAASVIRYRSLGGLARFRPYLRKISWNYLLFLRPPVPLSKGRSAPQLIKSTSAFIPPCSASDLSSSLGLWLLTHPRITPLLSHVTHGENRRFSRYTTLH